MNLRPLYSDKFPEQRSVSVWLLFIVSCSIYCLIDNKAKFGFNPEIWQINDFFHFLINYSAQFYQQQIEAFIFKVCFIVLIHWI